MPSNVDACIARLHRKHRFPVLGILALIVIFWSLTLFGVPWLVRYFRGWPVNTGLQPGTFGDMFGALNALFSGLAFAGVIYALSSQRRISQAENLLVFVDYWMNPKRRRQRGVLLQRLSQKPWKDWTPKEIQIAEQVCGQFNYVGFLLRHGMIPAEHIADLGNRPVLSFRATQAFLNEYVRPHRGDTVWRNFDWLAGQLGEPIASYRPRRSSTAGVASALLLGGLALLLAISKRKKAGIDPGEESAPEAKDHSDGNS